MKLLLVTNEGILMNTFQDVDRLDLSRDVDGWRVLGFIREGVKNGKMLNQVKHDEKKQL